MSDPVLHGCGVLTGCELPSPVCAILTNPDSIFTLGALRFFGDLAAKSGAASRRGQAIRLSLLSQSAGAVNTDDWLNVWAKRLRGPFLPTERGPKKLQADANRPDP